MKKGDVRGKNRHESDNDAKTTPKFARVSRAGKGREDGSRGWVAKVRREGGPHWAATYQNGHTNKLVPSRSDFNNFACCLQQFV